MVIATQNPVEQAGTYSLPEAQLDRFLIKTSLGYPDHNTAVALLLDSSNRARASKVSPIIAPGSVTAMAQLASEVFVDASVLAYLNHIVTATRSHKDSTLGVSMRGALALARAVKTWALANGRTYVTPDDVRELAVPVLAHRIMRRPGVRLRRRDSRGHRRPRARRRRAPGVPRGMSRAVPATERGRGYSEGPLADRHRASWSLARRSRRRPQRPSARGAGVLARVFGFAAPVARVISPTGWIVLAVALVAFLASRVFGWVEFGYVGATLAAAMLVAVAFVFGRATFRVRIELNPHRVVAGERALGRMLVTNAAAKPSLPSRMELPVGDGVAEFVIPGLAPNVEHEELFAVPTHRRAVIVAGPAITVRGDQLGLLRRTVRWTDEIELFVHPVTTRLAPSAAGLVRDLEGEITKTITNNDISFHALRAYEPGDALRNVHWRTSARTGQLMVRQFEETRRSQLTIVHTTDRDAYASDDEFELAISITASIGVQVVRDGTRMSIVTERMPLKTATPTALLDDASRLARDIRRPPEPQGVRA